MPFQLRQWSRQYTAVLLSMPVVESRKLPSLKNPTTVTLFWRCQWKLRIDMQPWQPFPLAWYETKCNETRVLWLVKWCKIHKVYIHSHSMLLLLFRNIFIHFQQPNLHSRNIFIHIYRCISYSRLYLLTFTRCLDSHSTCYIHSHSRSKYSSVQHFLRTTFAHH